MSDDAERFATLFGGYERHHYHFVPQGQERGKIVGKYVTVRDQGPTIDLWERHLAGEYGLQVIPLREDCTVLWGCLDIDDRSVDISAFEQRVISAKFPLVICRSKSGGIHAYLFLEEPAPGADVLDLLCGWAQVLQCGSCEVFPKQTVRLSDLDIGSAVNMPYHGGDGTTRYAIRGGKKLSPREFLDYAASVTVSMSSLNKTAVDEPASTLFPDGPPCLQHLEMHGGFPEGTRNEGMYNVAVYAAKRGETGKIDAIMQAANVHLCNPPLQMSEIMAIIKGATRKDYEYKCKSPPICDHCNRRVCTQREYGVGEGSGVGGGRSSWPAIEEVTLQMSHDLGEEMWFVTVAGQRLGPLRTDDITSQAAFRKILGVHLAVYPTKMPENRYDKIIGRIMKEADRLPPEDTLSEEAQFNFFLSRFLCQRSRATTAADIRSGYPYYSEAEEMIYFHSEALIQFFKQHRLSISSKKTWIYTMLRKRGANKKFFNIENKEGFNAWGLKPTDLELDETDESYVPDFTAEEDPF